MGFSVARLRNPIFLLASPKNIEPYLVCSYHAFSCSWACTAADHSVHKYKHLLVFKFMSTRSLSLRLQIYFEVCEYSVPLHRLQVFVRPILTLVYARTAENGSFVGGEVYPGGGEGRPVQKYRTWLTLSRQKTYTSLETTGEVRFLAQARLYTSINVTSKHTINSVYVIYKGFPTGGIRAWGDPRHRGAAGKNEGPTSSRHFEVYRAVRTKCPGLRPPRSRLLSIAAQIPQILYHTDPNEQRK